MLKVLAGVVVVVVVAVSLAISPVFKISKIDLNQNQSCISDEKLKNYQVTDQNILLFKTVQLQGKLKADFNCAKEVKIKKFFPKKLQIEVQTSEQIVKIDGTGLAITRDGQISSNALGNLPTIFLPSQTTAQDGQKITDSAVRIALEVVALLQKSDFSAQNIRFIENGDIAVYDTNGTIALFSTQKDANVQVDSLQALLAKAKIDPLKIAKIDLRFDKPT